MIKFSFLVVGQVFIFEGMAVDQNFCMPIDTEIPVGSTLDIYVEQDHFFSPESDLLSVESSGGDIGTLTKVCVRELIDSGRIKIIEIIVKERSVSLIQLEYQIRDWSRYTC